MHRHEDASGRLGDFVNGSEFCPCPAKIVVDKAQVSIKVY
jgi:hypothetical protein